jgi:hypothetical protein
MRAGADRWCVGRLRLCIHCLLLIRWIDGVDAGRVGVPGGGVGARSAWFIGQRISGYVNSLR